MNKKINFFIIIFGIFLFFIVRYIISENQFADILNLFRKDLNLLQELPRYVINPKCSSGKIEDQRIKVDDIGGDTDLVNNDGPDLIITNIELYGISPENIEEIKKRSSNINGIVSSCGILYESEAQLIEAQKKAVNCAQLENKSWGAAGTGFFNYQYKITIKNIGNKPSYYNTVKYNVVNNVNIWDFGLVPWLSRNEVNKDALDCSDAMPITLQHKINKLPEKLCNAKYCASIERVTARNNYCQLINNALQFKMAYDDIKEMIINSEDYKNVSKKSELDNYLKDLAKDIKLLYDNCFPDKISEDTKYSDYPYFYGPGRQSIICNTKNTASGELSLRDYTGKMKVSGANSLFTEIGIKINKFRYNDRTGIYKGIPISESMSARLDFLNVVAKTDNVVEKLNPGEIAEIIVGVRPPILFGGSGTMCKPDIGYWEVFTETEEINKNNNYDSAGSSISNNKEAILSYYKSDMLTGAGTRMYSNNNLNKEFNYLGSLDNKMAVAPHALIPGIKCAYIWP
jgi:hypothetical protein